MITGLLIAVYAIAGLAVGRWTAIRRDITGVGVADEDDTIAVFLAMALWPFAAAYYAITAPPRPAKQQRLERKIKELEKELEL